MRKETIKCQSATTARAKGHELIKQGYKFAHAYTNRDNIFIFIITKGLTEKIRLEGPSTFDGR